MITKMHKKFWSQIVKIIRRILRDVFMKAVAL